MGCATCAHLLPVRRQPAIGGRLKGLKGERHFHVRLRRAKTFALAISNASRASLISSRVFFFLVFSVRRYFPTASDSLCADQIHSARARSPLRMAVVSDIGVFISLGGSTSGLILIPNRSVRRRKQRRHCSRE